MRESLYLCVKENRHVYIHVEIFYVNKIIGSDMEQVRVRETVCVCVREREEILYMCIYRNISISIYI